MLAALVARLSSSTGLALRFDTAHELRTSGDADGWRHDLVWACGLLSMRVLERGGTDAEIVAAPVFAGQDGARYHSLVVTRSDGDVDAGARVARGRVAINEFASWSGCHALLAHLDARDLPARFAAVTRTGSHRASLETLARGEADVAAIDHTVWDHLSRTEPALTDALRVVERTRDWPAPPFLLSRALPGAVRERLTHALVAIGENDVEGLDGIEPASADAYRTLLATANAQSRLVDELRREAR